MYWVSEIAPTYDIGFRSRSRLSTRSNRGDSSKSSRSERSIARALVSSEGAVARTRARSPSAFVTQASVPDRERSGTRPSYSWRPRNTA